MSGDTDAFDVRVRVSIYDAIFSGGTIPTAAAVAAMLACSPDEAAAGFRRLAERHVVVLQEGSDEILMANPFSAVPTPFQVEAGGRTYWGNCVWDALGILVMLQQDGRVATGCGDCNAAMAVMVRDGALVDSPGVGHFSVPAKRWWDNIVFT
ncbi:MAG TPA: organomercurial lyase [Ktedonobacterales bacterium]|nr:organomercurial lyase [Ktedonobacterales bacterium]